MNPLSIYFDSILIFVTAMHVSVIIVNVIAAMRFVFQDDVILLPGSNRLSNIHILFVFLAVS